MLLLGNNAANHTSKLGVEPGLDPPVTARVKVACVEGLDVVDPLVGSVADVFLIACEECMDACMLWQTVGRGRSEQFQSVPTV